MISAAVRRAGARRLLAALVGVAMLGGSACLPHRPPVAEDFGAIMLRVENRGLEDMIVYAIRGGLSDRLGRASVGTTFSVSLDSHVDGSGQVQLVAEPLGGKYGAMANARTQVLVLKAGMTVIWTIPTDHSRSFVEVR